MYISSFWSDTQTPGSAESSLLQERRNRSPAETWMDWKQLVGGVWQVPGPRGWPRKHRCTHNQEFQNSGKYCLFREGQQPTWPEGRGPAEGALPCPTQLCRQGGGGVWGGAGPWISPEKWWEITQWSLEELIDCCLTGARGRTCIFSKVCKSIWSEIMENRLKASPRWGGVPGVRVQAAFLEREERACFSVLIFTCLSYATRQIFVDLLQPCRARHGSPKKNVSAYQSPCGPQIALRFTLTLRNPKFPKGSCSGTQTVCFSGLGCSHLPPLLSLSLCSELGITRLGGRRRGVWTLSWGLGELRRRMRDEHTLVRSASGCHRVRVSPKVVTAEQTTHFPALPWLQLRKPGNVGIPRTWLWPKGQKPNVTYPSMTSFK